MSESLVDNRSFDASKRTWLIASSCAGAVGVGAVAVPFVSSFQPSERQPVPLWRWISQAQARRKSDGGVARQARVDHSSHT